MIANEISMYTRAMIEVREILTSVIKALGEEGHWTCC